MKHTKGPSTIFISSDDAIDKIKDILSEVSDSSGGDAGNFWLNGCLPVVLFIVLGLLAIGLFATYMRTGHFWPLWGF